MIIITDIIEMENIKVQKFCEIFFIGVHVNNSIVYSKNFKYERIYMYELYLHTWNIVTWEWWRILVVCWCLLLDATLHEWQIVATILI